MLTLIAAVAKNRVIGSGNTIPWHLPEDFKHFKETTEGHTVIMGSKTWDSLPSRFRPLPRRHNIVVSRDRYAITLAEEGAHWSSSIEMALAATRRAHAEAELFNLGVPFLTDEIFVIGGSSMYEQTIDIADRLLISEVNMTPEGDAYFPIIDPNVWDVVSERECDTFTIKDFRRKA
jgi:dihydrofolate reductase